jgi:hypothetical protein
MQVTWPAGGTTGTIANITNPVTWTSIVGSGTALFFTGWSAQTTGTFGFSGSVTANAYTAGDTLTFAIGSITASLTLAS